MTDEIDRIYNEYQDETNMSYSELWDWAKNPCSRKASIGRTAIKRNLLLKKTSKDKWTLFHVKEAKKALSFLARHKNQPSGQPVRGCNISKRTIALKNWAFDPNK